jgi:hypothetical protein
MEKYFLLSIRIVYKSESLSLEDTEREREGERGTTITQFIFQFSYFLFG